MRPATLLATALAALLSGACAPVPAEPNGQKPAPAPAAPAATRVGEPPAPTPAVPVAPAVPTPQAPPAPPAPVDDCGLTSTIAADRGRDGTKYTLTLKNAGSVPRTLVTPGDGSEDGRRTPMLKWSATRDGAPAPEVERPGCGMMNAIEASEIFTLAPGESRAMSTWIAGPSFAPGRYEVRLRYINDPRPNESANVSPEVAALLRETSACDVTSAPLALQLP